MLHRRTMTQALQVTIPEGAHKLSAHLSSHILWTHALTPLSEIKGAKNYYAYTDGSEWKYGRLGYEGDFSEPGYYFVEKDTGDKFLLTPDSVRGGRVVVRTLTQEEARSLAAGETPKPVDSFDELSANRALT